MTIAEQAELEYQDDMTDEEEGPGFSLGAQIIRETLGIDITEWDDEGMTEAVQNIRPMKPVQE